MLRIARVVMISLVVCLIVSSEAASAKPWAWVWYPGRWRKSYNCYYGRKTFNIDDKVTAAYVFFSGDNFTSLYLNGKVIGGSGDWYSLKPVTLKTMGPLLRRGKNVLSVRVQNDDYEGGFVLKGMILLANGKRILLHSNETWRCHSKGPKGWTEVDFDDSKWKATEVIGTPPAGPWGSPSMPPSRLPIGSIEVGNADSEKQAKYSGGGEIVKTTATYVDGTKLADTGRKIAKTESFRIKLPAQGYVVLRRRLAGGQCSDLRVAIDGKDAGVWHSSAPGDGKWTDAYFVVSGELTQGKPPSRQPGVHGRGFTLGAPEITVTLTPTEPDKYVAYRYDFFITFEWYMLGEKATGSLDLRTLGKQAKASPNDATLAFRYGLALEGERSWPQADAAYRRCVKLAAGSDLGESAYRNSCLARAMQVLPAARKDPRKLFEIASFLKLTGFYAEAADVLRESIAVKPTADAYDQLGEAMLYGGRPINECISVWKEGLKRFPPKDTNRWRTIIAMHPSPNQKRLIPAQKVQLQIMLDMIYLSSRGRMALDAKILVSPPPVQKLFKTGEMDCVIGIAGGAGGGTTLGPDVSYGHAASSGFGFVTCWDVAWHEWIHQFECGLASSGNGPGWGGCHGSTHYGYRPPWWNWYRAAMRYYVRPGQHQRTCVADHVDVPYVDKWLVKGAFSSPDIYPNWICYKGRRNAQNFYWNTRKSFTLSEKPTKAVVAATADDRYVLYVNGKRVGAGASWRYAPAYDVTKLLRKGENIIAICAKNDTFGGGVLSHVMVEFKSGKRMQLASDASWKTEMCSNKAFDELKAGELSIVPPWTRAGFDDSEWKKSEVIGRYPCGPWGVFNIHLPDSVMKIDFAGRSAAAPSEADGWKPVALKSKMARVSEIAPQKNDTYQTMTYAFSYIYCPADMRAQMSVGAARRIVGKVNGEQIFTGGGWNYPTLPRVFPVTLKKGWNRLLVKAEDIAQKSVFWVKIYRPDGKAIKGLKCSNVKPAAGIVPDQKTLPSFDPARPKYYRWADVSEDPYWRLPQLTAEDLAALTGYKGLKLIGGNNYLFVDLGAAKTPAGYKPLSKYSGGEYQVNNCLTWDFEPAAVVRYQPPL